MDIVLGMDWLARWNPVIDWKRQVIHLYVNRQWTQVHGVLLDGAQHVGTVKVLDAYDLCEKKELPDWVIAKKPMLWNMESSIVQQSEQVSQKDYAVVQKEIKPSSVKQMSKQENCGQRTIISAKRMNKLLKAGEEMYLAVILPSSLPKPGMTFKVKQQMMKDKGPVRKAPPIAETRERMCKEAPGSIRKQLQDVLQEYEDIFPEKLPKGRPPKRTVEFEIKTEEGTTPPNKPPYRLSPKEHEELQAQIEDLLAQGHIRPSSSPYGAPVLFVPKKDGRWRMCVDYRALNR